MADTCTTFAFPGAAPCGHAAVLTGLVGCVHEHICDISVCQYCVERLAQGGVHCLRCREVDGHECELVFLAEIGEPAENAQLQLLEEAL